MVLKVAKLLDATALHFIRSNTYRTGLLPIREHPLILLLD